MRQIRNSEGVGLEIYFSDLSEQAQKEFVEFMGGDIEDWEIFSLGTIPKGN